MNDKLSQSAVIRSIQVFTGEMDGSVSPGKPSQQDVNILVYPAKYSRRLFVSGSVVDGPASDAPVSQDGVLQYRRDDGSLRPTDRRYRDVQLSTRRVPSLEEPFELNLEHAASCSTPVVARHAIMTSVATAELLSFPEGVGTGVPTERDRKLTEPKCSSAENP